MGIMAFVVALVVGGAVGYWMVTQGAQHIGLLWIGIIVGFILFMNFAKATNPDIWGPALVGFWLGGILCWMFGSYTNFHRTKPPE